MTIGVLLGKVSLNISYFEKLGVGSPVKQSGIGLFALVGLYMPYLWPICCLQLQRLMDEQDGLLKAVKILIGLFDFRHCAGFKKERSQECDDLVAIVLERAGESMDWSTACYVNWIQQAHMRDSDNEGH